MESFFSSLSGRIVCILAILIVIFGIAFAVNIAKGVSDEPSEESEQVAASVTSSSEDPTTGKTPKPSDGKEETGETGEEKPAKEYKDVGAREGESKSEYLQRTSTVKNVINVSDSTEMMTESGVKQFLKDRGFGGCEVSYDYTADGKCVGSEEVGMGTAEKHPKYIVTYQTPKGDIWFVFVINGDIVACPYTYLVESENHTYVIVSESEHVTSYSAETNQFYEVIPEKSEATVMTVPKIDAETLNNITSEEMDKL